ncbi:MAG: hypothetical protein IJ631_02730 [Schwartzia sp.]|nr:hypothetical protein [Schwartzia sp. (in: firmicutes)]
MDILKRDTETLILDIISFYKNGSEGTPIVPEKLLDANPYNREIMEILKKVSGVCAKGKQAEVDKRALLVGRQKNNLP